MRKWRPPMANPDDPPKGDYRNYQGFQKLINSNDGQVDENVLEEHIEDIMKDPNFSWEEITPVDFSLLKLGDRIRYTTVTQKDEYLFRTGGWVISIDEDNCDWLVYRAHTHTNWTLQQNDCVRLWATGKKNKTSKVKTHVYKFKIPGEESSYNSYLPDNNGVMQRVYSTTKFHEMLRFENTIKFKSCLEGKEWIFI